MVEPIGDVLDRAAKLSASGRRRKAVALLRSAADAHPDSAEVWCRLAGALLDRGDAAGALDAVGRAMTLPGDKAWTQRLASKALSRLGRHAEAVAAARQAVRAAPADWRCRISLAEAFGAAGSWPDALDAAAQAVRYQPDHVRPYLVLGDAARRTGDLVTAERAFRTAMRRKPGDPRVRAELARLRPSIRSTATDTFADHRSLSAGRPSPSWTATPDRPFSSSSWQPHRPIAENLAADRWPAARSAAAWRRTNGLTIDRSAAGRSLADRLAAGRSAADWHSGADRAADDLTAAGRSTVDGPVSGRPAADHSTSGRSAARSAFGRPHAHRAPADQDLPARPSAFRRNRAFRRNSDGRQPDTGHPAVERRVVGGDRCPVPEKLAWRGIRQLSMTLVIAGMFLMVAGLPKPTPVLAWLGFAIPCVVVVLALVELVRLPAGSRFTVLTMPLRRPVIGLSCVLLALSNALVLLWAMLDRANAGTMEPLVFALVCAVCAGTVSLVNEA
jgi:Flp pilus assembly protein TadD